MNLAFNLSLAGYFTALLFAAANLFTKEQRRFAGATTLLLSVAALAQTFYMSQRWLAAGRAPFSNMFESLVLFSWTIVVVYLALRVRREIPVLGVATALLAVLTLAYASTFESKIQPLMPALRSNWLTVHVFTCFLGYGAVAVAFLSSLGYLVATRTGAQTTPTVVEAFEAATDKTISFGFLFLTVGIISGAVWANSAWGTYWSWDPKETWSLITWFIYAVFLHCRFLRGWRGRPAAWIALVGFLSVLFTYFGVNFLLSGLHSYAK
jgi:cytochrome c-type biogenesis protein CcsB